MEHITTDTVHIRQRRFFWETAVSELFTQTAVSIDDPRQFFGRIDWHRIGQVVFSDIRSSTARITREAKHIRHAEDYLIQINFQLAGAGVVRQDGREAVTRPGEFAIYDSARPYEMSFDGPFRQLSVDFPRDLLLPRFGRAERFTARTISGRQGPGRFLHSFVKALMPREGESEQAIESRLQDHLLDLLVTALSGMASDEPSRGSDSRAMTLLRIRTFIHGRLRDPDLAPAMVARGEGLSLRYLYDLFADQSTTVWRYIQDTRLDRCRMDIEDTGMFGRPLSEIGYSWGFKDPAHFSRAFRGRFGMTPRECREARRSTMGSSRVPSRH